MTNQESFLRGVLAGIKMVQDFNKEPEHELEALSAYKPKAGRPAGSYTKRKYKKGKSRFPRWTPEEDEIIRQNFMLSKKQLMQLLPGRTSAAVGYRASNVLKLSKRDAKRETYDMESNDLANL